MNVQVCLPLVLLSVILSAGCNTQTADNSATAPTTPTAPAAATQTETFTGTLSVQGTNVHAFNVAQVGALNVTLTSAGPPPTISIGIGVGTPVGTTCSLIVFQTTPAGSAAQISGTVTVAGAFCLSVYDVGNLANDVTYSVTVSHT